MSSQDPRDTELERAWRDAPRDEPPRSLDEAILARAREAVAPRETEPPSELWPLAHPKSWFMRWRVPLAVAATLLVSATVTLLVYETGMEEPPPVVTDRPLRKSTPPAPTASGTIREKEPAPSAPAAPAPPLEATQPSADAARPPSPTAKRESPSGEQRPAKPESPMPATPSMESGRVATPEPKRAEEALGASREAPAQSAAPVPLPTERAPAPAAAGAAAPASPRAAPAPMAAPPPPASQAAPRDNAALEKRDESSQTAPATRAKAAAFATPDAYIERIRELKRAGRDAEANELLEELKRRFPAFEIPEDLRPR